MSEGSGALSGVYETIPSGWRLSRLTDAVRYQEGPGILAKDFVSEGIPLVRLKGLERPVATLSGCNYLNPSTVAKRWSHFRLDKGDLLLSSSASLGRVAEVGDEVAGAVPYTGIIRFRAADPSVSTPFLKYFLQSHAFAEQIRRSASGSVINHFGPLHLREMALLLPPLPEQRAIAHILGTLDDKIELNRQMSTTLEAMARALFESWFVRFDPVRANAEGRDTGLPADIAALFPDSFEQSEIGEVPKGWRVAALDTLAQFLNGLALQKFPASDAAQSLPVIKIAQLTKGDAKDADRCSSNLPREYVVQDGDILFSWSGSLVLTRWTGGVGALNQHLFKVTPTGCPAWFIFEGVRNHLPEFQRIAAGKATTMGHIQRHHLSDAKVALPSSDTLTLLGASLDTTFERVLRARLQSRTLTSIRDTLLPKLISGELRVPDAERALATAGVS